MTHPNFVDLTDQKFEKLLVIQRGSNNKSGRATWICKCDCGAENIQATGKDLRAGKVRSCGCLGGTHHLSKHPIYSAWKSLRRRCNKETTRSHRYKDRGIKVCERWLNSFENFYADMGSTWKEGLSLDRIDNDGNYEPGNCRWATPEEQASNRENNRKLTYNGETKTISQWARRYNHNPGTLWNRIYLFNWEIEKALKQPS